MNKDSIGKALSIISLLVAITFAAGSYITNSFISMFHLIDYNLLKPQAILSGITFFVFILIHVYVLLLFMDTTKIGNNTLLRALVLSSLKLIYLTVTLFLLFNFNEFKNPIYTFRLFGWHFNIKYLFLVFHISFPMPFISYYRDRLEKKKDLIDKIYILLSLIGFVGSIGLFLLFFYNEAFQKLLWFEILICFYFVLIVVLSPRESDKETRKYNGLFFYKKNETTNSIQINLAIVLSIVCIIPMVVGVMERYTSTIYPNINQSIGGGKMEKMVYFLENDTIQGDKLYETEKYIFILNKDSSVTKIDWDKVATISSVQSNSSPQHQ